MSFFATAEHEKEKLQYFASPEGRDDLYQYNQKESRTVLEVRMFALKIFFSLNKFHTIHAGVQNHSGNNVPLLSFSCFSWLRNDMWFHGVFLGVGGFSFSSNAF